MKSSCLITSLIVSVLLIVSGCAGKTATEPEEIVSPTVKDTTGGPATIEEALPDTAKSESVAAAPITEQPVVRKLGTVYFDYDSIVLTDQAKIYLQENAEWLQANPAVKAMIEGHCDERGSDGYNLALGERRAQETVKYLADLGVAPDRLSIVSYGEERPAMPGHNDVAWQMNRRVEFKK